MYQVWSGGYVISKQVYQTGMKLKKRIVKAETSISFIDKTPQYGIASFEICYRFHRGKLVEVKIYPRQQPDATEYFDIDLQKYPAKGFWFSGYEGLPDPVVWQTWWCSQHKCNSITINSPLGAKYLSINTTVNKLHIAFTKRNWSE